MGKISGQISVQGNGSLAMVVQPAFFPKKTVGFQLAYVANYSANEAFRLNPSSSE
jgi:hypothetical protein